LSLNSEILWLYQKECQDPLLVGGKAATLARLFKDFKVPMGFVIRSPDIKPFALTVPLFELGSSPYAVRSSAIGEDGSNASYAGIHESVLSVTGARGIQQAAETVFQSIDSDRAIAYRKAMGLPKPLMRVLVQKQVHPVQMSGTAFSQNPVTGADETVIEAEKGVGGVVDGGSIPTTLVIPNDKPRGAAINDTALPVPLVEGVLSLSARLRVLEGHGVDIEWCYDGDEVWLTQCREITT
jgi:phosphoenolpyruvate synthase/pyruvate phosphate dikinase